MVGLDPVELIPRPWAYDLPVIELAEETHAPHYLTPAARCIAPLGESLPALTAALPSTDGSAWPLAEMAEQRARMFAGLDVAGDGLTPSAAIAIASGAFAAKDAATPPRLTVDAGAPASIGGAVGRAYREPLRGWRRRSGQTTLNRSIDRPGDHRFTGEMLNVLSWYPLTATASRDHCNPTHTRTSSITAATVFCCSSVIP